MKQRLTSSQLDCDHLYLNRWTEDSKLRICWHCEFRQELPRCVVMVSASRSGQGPKTQRCKATGKQSDPRCKRHRTS